MRFASFPPRPSLRDLVTEYVVIEGERPVENILLPETSITMAIRLAGSVDIDSGDGMNSIELAVVSGLRATPRKVRYAKGSTCLVTRFKQNVAGRFLGIPAHLIAGATFSVPDILGKSVISGLAQVAETSSVTAAIQCLESLLEMRVVAKSDSDLRIEKALHLLSQKENRIRIDFLAKMLGWSVDTFEKNFRAKVGISPKRFAGILRMQEAINRIRSGERPSNLPNLLGFFDQSHFIREFKRFSGQNPSQYFRTQFSR